MEAIPRTFLVPVTADPADCSTDSSLCLQEGRFLVSATWKKPDGSSGPAHAVRLTPDSGYFWFLEPDNVELVIKALDGCSVNSRYWFFSGGLTNLEVTISVADTVGGQTRTYSNPQGTAFKPIIDMTSLASCPAGGTAMSARSPEEPKEDELTAESIVAQAATRSELAFGCAGADTVLCIDGRFQIEATWQSAAGKAGAAHAVSLTSESGYFWFFDESNVELLVKTLDACGIGRGQWFFAAGLTTVGVQLKVTDTFTGDVRTYANPLGVAFLPIQDTAAFSFCPTPTPTFTPTSTPTPTATPTHTPRPTGTPRPTSTPRPTPTPTPVSQASVSLDCAEHLVCNHPTNICGFSPNQVHVHVGDTVSWSWSSGAHSTTSGAVGSPDGIWDSGTHTGPFTFSHTFTQIGSFHYFCTPGHFHWILFHGHCFNPLLHEGGVVIVDP